MRQARQRTPRAPLAVLLYPLGTRQGRRKEGAAPRRVAPNRARCSARAPPEAPSAPSEARSGRGGARAGRCSPRGAGERPRLRRRRTAREQWRGAGRGRRGWIARASTWPWPATADTALGARLRGERGLLRRAGARTFCMAPARGCACGCRCRRAPPRAGRRTYGARATPCRGAALSCRAAAGCAAGAAVGPARAARAAARCAWPRHRQIQARSATRATKEWMGAAPRACCAARESRAPAGRRAV